MIFSIIGRESRFVHWGTQGLFERTHRAVVAIDFGTSRTGYSYSFLEDKRPIADINWPGQIAPYPKAPTHLLYAPDGELDSWGYHALNKISELRKSGHAQDYRFVDNFKLALRASTNMRDEQPIYEVDGTAFNVISLVSDYLRVIKERAIDRVCKAAGTVIESQDIRWCLTVPAMWTEREKRFMRLAAKQAELFDEEDNFQLVLEPEAAAVYCQQLAQPKLDVGTTFMVVDCGGGTADITVHSVALGGRLDEIVQGSGGIYGSSQVDRAFKEFLIGKLTASALFNYREHFPVDYLEMLSTWERIKCNFDPNDKREVVYIPIHITLYRFLNQQYPEVLNKLAQEQNGDSENIQITKSVMIDVIFGPTIDRVIDLVHNQFSALPTQRCDYIFLVGGFAESPLLQGRVRSNLSTYVKEVVCPSNPGYAILQGAVLIGLEPAKIKSRRARLTYGAKSIQPFEEGVDLPEKRTIYSEHNGARAKDRFRVFVRAGQRVDLDRVESEVFHPVEAQQKSMDLVFYATTKKHPRYIDEEGVHELGVLKVDMPDTSGGSARRVEISMHFERAEIKITARDVTTGTEYRTQFRFSSTFDV